MKMKIEKSWMDVFIIIGITIVVYIGMRYILPIVFPFLLAFMIAALLYPLVDKIAKRTKVHHHILAIVVFLIVLICVGGLLAFAFWKLVKEIGCIIGEYQIWEEKAEKIWYSCCDKVEHMIGVRSDFIEEWGQKNVAKFTETLEEKIIPCIMNCSLSGIKGIAVVIGKIVVTLVATVLILSDYQNIHEKIAKNMIGNRMFQISDHMKHAGGTYIRAQLIIMVVVSGVCVLGLYLTHNSCAFVGGIAIGLCDALPFLGTGTVFVPWIIIKIFQGKYGMAIAYASIYITCSLIREFAEPKLVGKGLGIHPILVVISIYIGICLYGCWGVILGPLSALMIWEIYKSIKIHYPKVSE